MSRLLDRACLQTEPMPIIQTALAQALAHACDVVRAIARERLPCWQKDAKCSLIDTRKQAVA